MIFFLILAVFIGIILSITLIFKDIPNNSNFQSEFLTKTPRIENQQIILEIPEIEYQNNNLLIEPDIVGYSQSIISENQVFIIEPGTLGYLYENQLGAIKVKLTGILANSILIQILADKRLDGQFYERETINTYEIRTKECVNAFPLVMDANFEYCFELTNRDKVFILSYFIVTSSTLPKN